MTVTKNLDTSWWALRIALGLAAFLAGLDKFFNLLANWSLYLSPLAQRLLPVSARTFMFFIGPVEIIVGLAILTRWTRAGAYAAAAWLVAIAVNLLTTGMFFDIAVRDVVMAIAAFTLARLTEARNASRGTPHAAPREAAERPRHAMLAGLLGGAVLLSASALAPGAYSGEEPASPAAQNARRMIEEGRRTFRFDTFGDEAFWGGTLKLHQAIAGARLGGVGAGVSPKTALAVGLKVDVEALPESLRDDLAHARVNLDDPATTLALLKLNSVVGVTGMFDADGRLKSMGIQCAFCHSTVDDSFAPGIGRRLDGWPNRDLNVGAIIAVAPDLTVATNLLGVDDATVRAVLNSWGPGKFDASLFLDGKAFRPDGKTAATLIPPAFGLAGVNMGTWTGFGSTTYWNALVANLEMHGQGTFYDPRLNDAQQFPVAAKAGFGNVSAQPDLITPKLAALHFYQLAIPAPQPPGANEQFNFPALRGKAVFNGKAQCARCHVPPLFTEPGFNMRTADEIGIDDFQARRSPTGRYRTAPLKGLFAHEKGGFYHDGRFPTLRTVVDHYDSFLRTGLTDDEKNDLVAYLKTL